MGDLLFLLSRICRPPDPHGKLVVEGEWINHGQKHTHVQVTVGQLSLLTASKEPENSKAESFPVGHIFCLINAQKKKKKTWATTSQIKKSFNLMSI